MFIAHVPFGFLIARLGIKKPLEIKALISVCCGSIFPDFDLLRFYFLDNASRHHHEYWSHIPIIWGLIYVFSLTVLSFLKWKNLTAYNFFFIGIASHCMGDTLLGQIEWLWPFSERVFPLVIVQAKYNPWYLSFLFHWTFLLELFLLLLASIVLFKDSRRGR